MDYFKPVSQLMFHAVAFLFFIASVEPAETTEEGETVSEAGKFTWEYYFVLQISICIHYMEHFSFFVDK